MGWSCCWVSGYKNEDLFWAMQKTERQDTRMRHLLGVQNSLHRHRQQKFLFVDIGDAGRQGDGRVYPNSNLGCAVD